MKNGIPTLINLSTLIAFALVYYCAYYILLTDNPFNSSISSIIDSSHQLPVKQHFVVLALLPIYIAMIIFGASILGMYLGIAIQRLIEKAVNCVKRMK